MQTRDALRVYSRGSYDPNSLGPLEEHGERLLQAFEAREASRMAEAERRAELQGVDAVLDALRRVVGDMNGLALTDNRLPAIMTYDAAQMAKAAYKSSPGDNGLRILSGLLHQRWMQDGNNGMGSLSVGDLAQYRDHIARGYPKSAAIQLIEQEMPRHGFQTLDLQHLVRLASHVTDQESYEQIIEANGLGGSRPEQLRAAAFVMAMAGLRDEVPEQPDIRPDLEQRITARLGGGDDPIYRYAAPPMAPEAPMPEPMPGAGPHEMAPEDPEVEAEVPHDEETEEAESVESPITGEELVLELGVAKEEGPLTGEDSFGAAPGEADMELAPAPKMEGFEPIGQLQDAMGETVVMVEDPSAPGQMLEVTLRPVEEGAGEAAPGGGAPAAEDGMPPEPMGPAEHTGPAPGEGIELESAHEMCGEHDMPMGKCKAMHDKEASARWAKSPPSEKSKRQVEHIAESYEEEGDSPEEAKSKAEGTAWKQWNKDHGKKKSYRVFEQTEAGTRLLDKFIAPNLTTALARVASFGVDGQLFVNADRDEAVIAVSTADSETYLHIVGKDKSKGKGKKERKKLPGIQKGFNPGHINEHQPVQTYAPEKIKPGNGGKVLKGALSRAEVQRIAGALGLDAQNIEARLLDGDELVEAGYRLAMNAADEVEFGRAGGAMRIASLAGLDHVIGDFQAVVAARAVAGVDEAMRESTMSIRPLFRVACKVCGGVDEFMMPEEASATSCSSCRAKTSASEVAQQLKKAQLTDYVVLIEVPAPVGAALSDAQKRLRAERVKSALRRIVPKAEFDLDGDLLGITLRGASERALNAVANTLKSAFGVRELAAASLPPSPFVGQTPTPPQPAGSPAMPQVAPQQTAHTGTGAQQRLIDEQEDPLDKSKMYPGGKAAQFAPPEAPPMMPGGGGDEFGGEGGGGDEEFGGGGGEFPSHEPAMPMGGGATNVIPATEEIDMDEDQKTAIYSALRYFHQKQPFAGELELGAQVRRDYGGLLDMIAPEKSPQRRVLERQIGKMIDEVLEEPVLMFQGGRGHSAAIPQPKRIFTQHEDWVKVPSDLGEDSETHSDIRQPGKINPQVKPQSYAPKKPGHLGPDSDGKDMGSFGAPKPQPNGRTKVTTYAPKRPKNLGKDSETGENDMTRRMEEVSGRADKALRSATRRPGRRG